MLYHLRALIPRSFKYVIYYSFCHSHLTYGMPFIFLSSKSQIQKLFKVQKKFIKILFFYSKLTPSTQLFFPNSSILTLHDLIKYHLCLTGFKIFHSLYSPTITIPISGSSRNSNFILQHTTNNDLFNQIAIAFNEIHYPEKKCRNLSTFKNIVLHHLFNTLYNSII